MSISQTRHNIIPKIEPLITHKSMRTIKSKMKTTKLVSNTNNNYNINNTPKSATKNMH